MSVFDGEDYGGEALTGDDERRDDGEERGDDCIAEGTMGDERREAE